MTNTFGGLEVFGVGDGVATGIGSELVDGVALGSGGACTFAAGRAWHALSISAPHSAMTVDLIYKEPTKQGTVKLQRDSWELEVRPERGGRITSLKLRGEELLDQGIGVDDPSASGFVEGGAWGWDEMVPNLEPTETLPDHGEAWRLPWKVLGRNEYSLGMECEGRVLPWRLGRRIILGDDVDVHYTYTNVGTRPHNAFWCAHPLFRYEPGMELGAELPSDLPDGASTKVFLATGSSSSFRLGWRSGTRIEVRWDPSLTPEVAIWMCNGDIGGYRQVAVEPATATPELGPGESLAWWLQIAPL
jgi:hypothetical protein